MDLAKTLVRTIVRGFYTTEYVLIIDALAVHSTLTDADLAHVLGMQTKALRRLCGKLKEDGLINVQSRGEKKEGAPPSYFGNQTNGKDQQPKERLFYRDWYFINFHRAIDSIKYRMWKLNRHIESQGAPTAEKKDLICPRCKSTYTELEVMDNVGAEGFYCHRCDHLLESQEDTDGPAENESMKRMNDQLSKILSLMRTIDSTTVPENDFDTALRYHLPVERPDSHPGARTTVVDDRKPHIASSKGLAVAPEKVSVNLTESRDGADKAADAAARAEKREREAKQNALPEWISKSTLTGDVTTVGAKEEADRRRRELEGHHDYAAAEEAEAEDKKRDVVDNAVMDDYWKALKAEQERERREEEEGSEDEDEDEEDDFEDVEGMEVKREASPAKKPRLEEPVANGDAAVKKENKVSDTDDDDDDDELEFEDV